jgi:hypothetical protein
MTFRNFMLAACALGGLSACAPTLDLIEQGRPYAARTASELVQAECALPLADRQKNAEAVESYLASAGHPAKFTLDCDGDGVPDL